MLFDIIGIIGVVMILGIYGATQFDKIDVKGVAFSFYNGVGAICILISLWIDFNLSAFMVEASWLVISLFGLYNALRRKKS